LVCLTNQTAFKLGILLFKKSKAVRQ